MLVIKYIPNVITIIRIVISIFLIFIETFSGTFYIFYTLGGISDMLDGFIARKMHVTSRVGATLDSIADVIFIFAIFIRVIPLLIKILPLWCWWTILFITFIKCTSYIIGAFKFHKFTSLHTILNKITGGALFLGTYFIFGNHISLVSIIICSLGIISALEELLIIINSKDFNQNIKSIFQ